MNIMIGTMHYFKGKYCMYIYKKKIITEQYKNVIIDYNMNNLQHKGIIKLFSKRKIVNFALR